MNWPWKTPAPGASWTRRLRHLSGLLLATLAFAALLACGEATEDPEDCTPGEFFDEATELCTSCPPVVEPDCQPGCGFRIAEDENECPVAVCDETCRCADGEFFSSDSLTCETCETAADPPAICDEFGEDS